MIGGSRAIFKTELDQIANVEKDSSATVELYRRMYLSISIDSSLTFNQYTYNIQWAFTRTDVTVQ